MKNRRHKTEAEVLNMANTRLNPFVRLPLPVCVRGLRLSRAGPEAISCNMRYESWAELWLHPKSQNVLERNPAIRVNTGQSGFIYPCLRLHLSKGTSNLPTNVFNISTYLFIQFTFLSCLLKDHKLLKDTQSGSI